MVGTLPVSLIQMIKFKKLILLLLMSKVSESGFLILYLGLGMKMMQLPYQWTEIRSISFFALQEVFSLKNH